MSNNNGGPAFPTAMSEGLTLRDWFAGQMVGAAYSSFWTLQAGQVPEDWRVGLAAESYKMADAMLAAREK